MRGPSTNGDNQRKRARYRVLVLAGMHPRDAQEARQSPGRFRAALESLGIDPARHEELGTDRRHVRRRVHARYALPSYAGAPVRITRLVSIQRVPEFPELGAVSARMKALLLAAGVVRSEDGNVP